VDSGKGPRPFTDTIFGSPSALLGKAKAIAMEFKVLDESDAMPTFGRFRDVCARLEVVRDQELAEFKRLEKLANNKLEQRQRRRSRKMDLEVRIGDQLPNTVRLSQHFATLRVRT
jgi:hypothetical protein